MGTFRGDVVEFEAPRHVVFKERLRWFGAPVVEARVRYDLEPTPEGTVVRNVAESTLFGAFRAMKPMVLTSSVSGQCCCIGLRRSPWRPGFDAATSRRPPIGVGASGGTSGTRLSRIGRKTRSVGLAALSEAP